MFCSKCGSKALDEADFCSKCGAKLIKDESIQQPNEPVPTTPVKVEPTVSATVPAHEVDKNVMVKSVGNNNKSSTHMMTNEEAYNILKKKIERFSMLKEICLDSKGIIFTGSVYRYIVNMVNGQVRVKLKTTRIWTILNAIIGGISGGLGGLFGVMLSWNMLDGYGINESYIIPCIVFIIVSMIYGGIFYSRAKNEKDAVFYQIGEILKMRIIVGLWR